MKHHDPYLPAEALGIQPWERDGLIALLPDLDRGLPGFSMRSWLHCMGGEIARRAKRRLSELSVGLSCGFSELCWPATFVAHDASCSEAALAARSFLMTGRPDWSATCPVPTYSERDLPFLRAEFIAHVATLDWLGKVLEPPEAVVNSPEPAIGSGGWLLRAFPGLFRFLTRPGDFRLEAHEHARVALIEGDVPPPLQRTPELVS